MSLEDLEVMVKNLSEAGYQFTPLDDPGAKTVTLTFDDGYYNNFLFSELARAYRIPYLVLVSTHYIRSGDWFPWFLAGGKYYDQMHEFDYYKFYPELISPLNVEKPPETIRPMNLQELTTLANDDLVEIGCHGYYHQALSRNFQQYLSQESEASKAPLQEQLGQTPRYFAMANGIYTRWVARELLKSFERILTSDARPFKKDDRIIHRLNLANPNVAGPLTDQINRHLGVARQIKRIFRTAKKVWL